MSVEIICVGTELLLGEIVNTNASYLAKELAGLGVSHFFQTVVGDNESRIHQLLSLAENRSRLILFSGGLGPTPDDLTVASIASYFGVEMEERPAELAILQEKLESRGRNLLPENRKQASLPRGADSLVNPIGTAPGVYWNVKPSLTVICLPGVPSEMKLMFHEQVVPILRTLGMTTHQIFSRSLHTWGIPESVLAAKIQKFLPSSDPAVATYAGNFGVRVRISVRDEDALRAHSRILPVEEEINSLLGESVYGVTDTSEFSLAEVVSQFLTSRKLTVGVAESCTGGGLGAELTRLPGSSAYFKGGVIAYANEIKSNLLGVPLEIIEKHGAVSEEVARAMAAGTQKLLKCDFAVSITGVAGPGGGSIEKPVGTVCFGIQGPGSHARTWRLQFGNFHNRERIRALAVQAALNFLRLELASAVPV